MKKQDERFNDDTASNAYTDAHRAGRNLLINGDMQIDQRGAAGVGATGDYIWDRWKKTAGGMTQIVEDGNYEPSTEYTLSGTGVTTQQITSPASGHWTLPDVPTTARKVQLELGSVATPFDHRSYGLELMLCKRYYERTYNRYATYWSGYATEGSPFSAASMFEVAKRVMPTVTMFVDKAPARAFGNHTSNTEELVSTISLVITRVAASTHPSGYFAPTWEADAEL